MVSLFGDSLIVRKSASDSLQVIIVDKVLYIKVSKSIS